MAMRILIATTMTVITSSILIALATAVYADESTVKFGIDIGNEAIVRVDSMIYETADTSAKVSGSLKSGSRVEVLARKHAWYEVKYRPVLQKGALQGWLPLRSLKLKVGNGFTGYFKKILDPAPVERTAVSQFGDEEDPSNDATVTSVRGLSSQRLTNVEPDEEAVKALDKYAVDKKQASDFASQLGLKTRKVEYLVKAEEEKNESSEQKEGEEDF